MPSALPARFCDVGQLDASSTQPEGEVIVADVVGKCFYRVISFG